MNMITQKKSKCSFNWRTIANLMKDFCQSTSLHGYSYLSNGESIGLKIIWGIVIVAATGLGIVFLVNNTKAFMEATIFTYIESETSSLVVSICFKPRIAINEKLLDHRNLFRKLYFHR